MRYIGRSCSYGESVLILQRKNKAFSFIFPCLMMKPKLRRELLMNWVLLNWKRKMVSINWLNFYTPVWKTDVLCRGNVSRLSVRPSLRPSSVRVFQTFLCLRLKAPEACFRVVRPSVRSLKYPHLTCTWVRWSTQPTVTVLRHVRPSVRPSVCRRHGFQSISQVCFGISISNFICILMVAIGRSLLIFSDVTFRMAAWRPYWIFWFPDSKFTLALNINFKLQWHNTYVYV